MKTKIALFFSALLLIPFFGLSQIQYPGGKPPDTLNQHNVTGAKTGYWEERSGDLICKGYFHQNNKEGAWVAFYTNNLIARIENYTSGVKNGPSVSLDRRGKVTYYEYYKNGMLNGPTISYSTNGDFIVSETYYAMNKKTGVERLYYDNGKIQLEANYLDNLKEGMSRWFNKAGRTVAEYYYKQGNFEGLQKTFYENDSIQSLSNWINNELMGDYQEFYRNGKIKISGKFIKGVKDGIWTEYDETGKAIRVQKCKNGVCK